MTYRSEDLMRLAQGAHTDAVRALEDDTTTLILGDLETQLDALARTTLTAWTRVFGSPTAPAAPGQALARILAAVRAAIRRHLDPLGARAHAALTPALERALALGAGQGREFVRAAAGRARTVRPPVLPRELAAEAARITALVAHQRDRALMLLHPAQAGRWHQLLYAIGAARSAAAAVHAHTAWLLGQAVDTGLTAAAETARAGRLWVAEADACVRCLAYTGLLADDSGRFPGGLSWDPRQRSIGAAPIGGPPLHPHCRCRAVPWSIRWRPAAGSVPFPLALQREAQRSLAYGAGRPSESRAGRLRAVRELVTTVPDLLPAVEARARTALLTGRFPAAA